MFKDTQNALSSSHLIDVSKATAVSWRKIWKSLFPYEFANSPYIDIEGLIIKSLQDVEGSL